MSDEQRPDLESSLPAPYQSGGKRKAPTRTSHTVAKVLLSSMMVLAMITGLGVTFLYRHLNGNLHVEDVSAQLGDNRPQPVEVEGPQDPLNILVMGSDTRDGEGNNIDGLTGDGERSDTTILIHLSADRQTAYGISIPRDTLVDRPECVNDDGDTLSGGSSQMWNAAFAVGGPACTIKQFEALTNVRIDNYVKVDFAGFRNMVDAVDGVEVCVPEEIDDREHGILIKEGTRTIDGREALAYVRVRHGVGDGSDIGRIKRQQAFVAAMVNKVVSGNTLARPDRLIGFLNAATSSLTTDIQNIAQIAKIGYQFKDVGLKRIQFVTVPFQYSTAYPGRVELLPEAEDLWEKVRNDSPLGRLRDGAISADNPLGASPSATQSASPSDGASSPSASTSPTTTPSEDESAAEAAAAREAVGLCA
ncbi:LCP family protein [Nocardioides sp.]|uniref:LCP family protein n=1 Tax=Nocardioides sp. TaxID=35761 RepID=UPI003565C412